MNRSIIFGALVLSAAILINGYLDRASRPAHFDRPSPSAVKKAVVDSLNYAFQAQVGDNIIADKKRDVQEISIGDIRYAAEDSQMKVEFSLVCADRDRISSQFALRRDDFGVYRGDWEFGTKKAYVEIR